MRNAMFVAGIILAGVAANLGLLNTGGEPQGSSASNVVSGSPKSETHAKNPSDPAIDNDPIMKLYEVDDPNNVYYKAGRPGPFCKFNLTTQNNGPDYCTQQKEPWGLLRNQNVDFVIATVPDPVETRLTVLFDRSIEAILLAASQDCYLLDRFWMPWRQGQTSTSDDPQKNAAAAKKEADRNSLPGILIFHGKENVDGIQAGHNCRLRQAPNLDPNSLTYNEPPILAVFLVGESPTAGIHQNQFFRSLYYAVALGLRPRLRGVLGPMFSGSFPSMQRALEDAAIQMSDPTINDLKVFSGSVTGTPPSSMYFYPMLSPDQNALTMIQSSLNYRVMVLSEEGTTYGTNVAELSKEKGGNWTGYSNASYPRDISALRNAQPETSRTSGSVPQAGQSQLSATLRDTESGFDSVPRFAAGQTPVTQEAVMLHIAESIHRQRVDTVVVTSTNVLDSLFLTRFLRQATPDVRVVTLDSDLLFVHGTDSADYAGSLAVVNHPLNPEILRQRDSLRFPNSGLARFNSNISAGIHGALRSLLRGKPLPNADQWLTVIGRGIYWPVRVDRGEKDVPPEYRVNPPTHAAGLLHGLAGLTGVCIAGLYCFAVTRGKSLRWCAELQPRKLGYHMIANLALFAALCVICFAPAYLWRYQQAGWGRFALWIAIAASACLAAAIHAAGRRRWWWALGFAPAISIWIFLRQANLTNEVLTRYFRALRASDPTNGVSPTVPLILLLMAVAWWAWTNKRRLILADERNPQVEPLPGISEKLFTRLSEILKQPILGGHWVWAAGVFGLAVTLMLRSKLYTLESAWYTTAVVLLTGATVGMAALSAGGLVEIWILLRRLLRAFDGHPIREAFTKLPPVGSWSPLWPDNNTGNHVGLTRLVDTLDMLHSQNPDYYPGLKSDLSQLRSHVQSATNSDSSGKIPYAKHVKDMRVVANRIISTLCSALNKSTWSAGSSESLDKMRGTAPVQPDPKTIPDLLAAEAVAIRYVAFIRYVLLQIKNQISILTGGFVLVVLALNSYPFQGAGFLRWCITGAAIALGLIVVDIFAEIEKDATLTRLTDRTQGTVGREFYVKVISAGALPLLAAVASHFPSAGRLLFSWLQPALTALR